MGVVLRSGCPRCFDLLILPLLAAVYPLFRLRFQAGPEPYSSPASLISIPFLLYIDMASEWPATPFQFLQRFPNRDPFRSLPGDLRTASGSNWTAAHLVAAGVILVDHKRGFPILSNYMPLVKQKFEESDLIKPLGAVTQMELETLPHRELRLLGNPSGSFLVALADVFRSSPTIFSSSPRPERSRKQIN